MSQDTEFKEMVSALAKPGRAIREGLNDTMAHTLHMAIGVSGEAGELIDAIKRWVIYGKEIDLTNVIEELGDLEFYMEGLRQGLDITRQETLEANKLKLLKGRYKSGTYSDEQAINREDKNV